jgi:hypothetical protein
LKLAQALSKSYPELENSGAGKTPPCSEIRRSANRPTLANGGVTVFIGTSRAGDGAQGFGIQSSADALDFLLIQ